MFYVKITYECQSEYGLYKLNFTGRSKFLFLARLQARRYAKKWFKNTHERNNPISYNLVGETVSRE